MIDQRVIATRITHLITSRMVIKPRGAEAMLFGFRLDISRGGRQPINQILVFSQEYPVLFKFAPRHIGFVQNVSYSVSKLLLCLYAAR